MGRHGKNLIINNMKLTLIILLGIFASCKVTHVVKCECKQVVVDSTFLPATTLLPNYGGGVPMPFEERFRIDKAPNYVPFIYDTTSSQSIKPL